MLTRHRWFVLAVGAALAGCQDVSRPLGPPDVAKPAEQAVQVQGAGSDLVAGTWPGHPAHIIKQAAGAPALEAFRISLWVRRDQPTRVALDYQNGQPFLRFDVPRNGLYQRPNGVVFGWSDSVLVTLTIDPAQFVVGLEPTGLVFNPYHPAKLVIWYEHADPDLNGDGVVDATDRALRYALHIVTRSANQADWSPVRGGNGLAWPFVYAEVRHFSQWAVSW